MKCRRRAAVLLLIAILMLALLSCAEEETVYPRKYEDIIEHYADEYGVPASTVYAIVYAESTYRPTVVSSSGAVGLMQIMPATYKDMCGRIGIPYIEAQMKEPETNIRVGTYYLAYLYDIFGNWETVYAAYHAGMGNVSKWLQDSRYADGKGGLKKIPFEATETYVSRVCAAFAYYEENPVKEK